MYIYRKQPFQYDKFATETDHKQKMAVIFQKITPGYQINDFFRFSRRLKPINALIICNITYKITKIRSFEIEKRGIFRLRSHLWLVWYYTNSKILQLLYCFLLNITLANTIYNRAIIHPLLFTTRAMRDHLLQVLDHPTD